MYSVEICYTDVFDCRFVCVLLKKDLVMVNISRKTVSFLLITLILVGVLFGLPAKTQAVSFSQSHPNTHVNTGNGAVDITEVAKTQVGYKQNSAGTKYGNWYNPSFVNQPWCAMFVSWCAEQAGISQSVIQKFASCSMGVRWFKEQKIWRDSAYYGGSAYVPQKGDIIFYRNNGSSNLSDHVGIVLGMNGTYINVIEGNATNESCCEFKTNTARSLNSKYVIGYATPNYEGGDISEPQKEPKSYENWQVTDADTLSLRKSYSTKSERLTTIGQGAIIKVTEFKITEDYLWGYTKVNGKSGWCALDYCTYINGSVNGEYYQHPPKFNSKSVTIYLQESLRLKPDNSLGATYKSTDKEIVKVSKKGMIRGIKQGSAVVKCITNTGVAKCEVVVVNPKIEKNSLTTCVDDTCKVKVVGAQEKISYTSNNEEIATVDEDGVVTGISAGKTVIIATVSGVELKCKVKILKESTSYQRFKVKSNNAFLRDDYKGKTLFVVPKGTVLRITEVKYSSTYSWGKTSYDNTDGWIVLNSCKYIDGSINGQVYKVAPYLKNKTNDVYVGDTFEIVVKDSQSAPVFKSKKPSIAAVDDKGVVTAIKEGTTNILVEIDDKVLKCKVKVNNPKLDKQELHLGKGQRIPLTVTGGSGQIAWKSQDNKVAKVNSQGVVIARGFGQTTITATRNKMEIICVVNVYDPIITPEDISLKVGKTKKLKVSQNYSDEIIWKSSKKNIVGVSQKGKIRAKSKGEAIVTATVDGVTLKCNVTVK